jgi:hypothetical protein
MFIRHTNFLGTVAGVATVVSETGEDELIGFKFTATIGLVRFTDPAIKNH